MKNPILQLISGNQQKPQNNILEKISFIRSMLNTGNIDKMYQDMIRNNPQFNDFVEKNKNKSIEDVALEYDIDLSILKQLLK